MSPGPAWRQVKTKAWFSADLHLGHAGIIDYCDRPFRDLDEMHEVIITRWNERVSPDDIAWLLGDVAVGGPEEVRAVLPLLARLNGHKYLLAGNHDIPFHGFKGYHGDGAHGGDPRQLAEWSEIYRTEAGFTAVVTGEAIRRTGHAVRLPLLGGPPFGHPVVLVSHFPYAGESREGYADRYPEYRPRPPKRGPRPWVVHGHVHTAWAIDAQARQINVGVDVWDFAPVEAAEIAALIQDFTVS